MILVHLPKISYNKKSGIKQWYNYTVILLTMGYLII